MVVPAIDTTSARQGGPGPVRHRTVLVLAVLALVVVLVIVLSWRAARDDDQGDAPHQVSLGRGTVTVAQLDLVGGTDSLTITAADLGDDLVAAGTPVDSRAVPVLQAAETGRVLVTSQGDAAQQHGNGPVNLAIRLARGVQWSILINGGTQLLRLDLSTAQLSSLDITQGVATVEAALPQPRGVLVTRISGGASAVRLHLPPDVPAGFTFSGGGGSATVDAQHRQGIPGGTMMTTDGWTPSAANRIDVALDAGIGSLVADRYR